MQSTAQASLEREMEWAEGELGKVTIGNAPTYKTRTFNFFLFYQQLNGKTNKKVKKVKLWIYGPTVR